MKLIPMDKYTILKEKEEKDNTSILYIPDNSQKKDNIGIVVATTHDNLKDGDEVYYKQYSSNDITINDKSYKTVLNEDILLKIEE